MKATKTFKSYLEKFDSNLWVFHIVIPEKEAKPFIKGTDRRVVCTLNGTESFQCALMPGGPGVTFINLNKKIRDKLKLKLGSEVTVSLEKDNSEYGLPMPEELAELMKMDEEGSALFHALTPGKQRTLLHIVGSVKNSDIRIRRALAIVNHLKLTGGKINYKQLNEQMKNAV